MDFTLKMEIVSNAIQTVSLVAIQTLTIVLHVTPTTSLQDPLAQPVPPIVSLVLVPANSQNVSAVTMDTILAIAHASKDVL